MLVDAEGRTLYRFTRDTAGSGASACYGECTVTWPPFTVPADKTPTGGPGVSGELSTIVRTDGTLQVTYDGVPLYFFANDVARDDTNGQGLGGVWFVVAP